MPPWGDTTSNMSMLSYWYSVISVILMKAEGNIFDPLVVSFWKQSQRGKERGAHSRYIISYHIVRIWTSWYDKLVDELFVWEQGKKKSLLIMAQPYKK